jgi:hypothetical protein
MKKNRFFFIFFKQFDHIIVDLPEIGLVAVRETKPEVIQPLEEYEEEPEIEQTM